MQFQPQQVPLTVVTRQTDREGGRGLGREVGRSRKREGERERGGRAVGSSFVA